MPSYIQLPNQNRLSGINTLAYMGVEAVTPPQFVIEKRAPTTLDYKLWNIGTLWLDKLTQNVWMLVDKAKNVATWSLTVAGSLRFETDDGFDSRPLLGMIHLYGGPNIDTSSNPNGGNTLIIGVSNDITISGNLRVSSLAAGNVTTDGTGLFQSSNGLDGQVLIGGGAIPNWANLTPGAGIAITNGPNSITITNTGGGGAGFGGLVGDDTLVALPDAVLSQVKVLGGPGIDTSAPIASPNTLFVGIENSTANGQIRIGGGVGVPTAWGSITSTGLSIAITHPAPNTINIESLGGGGGGAVALTADDTNDATVVAGKIKVYGGQVANWVIGNSLIKTTAAANTLTVNLAYPTVTGAPLVDDGRILVTSGVAAPEWTQLTAGPNITITPNHIGTTGTITISANAGAGSGVNVFDCISGTAIPKPAAPNLIYVEGDAYRFGYVPGRYNITTVCPGGADIDLIEVVLNDSLFLPNTNAGGTTGVINFNLIPFIHNYGTYNSFFGGNSGNRTLTTANATRNTGIGYGVLSGLTGTGANLGRSNTGIGTTALNLCSNGSYNVAVGAECLDSLTTGSFNTAAGTNSLSAATTSSFNTAFGGDCLTDLTTGSPNTCVGYGSGNKITQSINNTAVGYQSLFTMIGAAGVGQETSNTAIGHQAMLSMLKGNNVAVGSEALSTSINGTEVVAVGCQALHAASGASYSTAIGYRSMGTGITTGQYNTAVGHESLMRATTANDCVAIGAGAQGSSTTGFDNVSVGRGSLASLVSGGSNIAVGHLAGSAYTGAQSSNILIGNIGTLGDGGAIRIGTAPTHDECYVAGIYTKVIGATRHPVWVDNTGKLGAGYGAGEVLLSAYLDRTVLNCTGDETKYYLGSTQIMHAETNHGGGTYVSGGGGTPARYTFPVDGAYLLTIMIRLNGLIPPIVIPPPPPPVFAGYDPIVFETTGSASTNYAYYPGLKYDGYTPYQSCSFSAIARQIAGDYLKWYIQIDYRPGESIAGGWPLTYNQQSKTIGIDSGYGTNNRFTFVGVTLLEAY